MQWTMPDLLASIPARYYGVAGITAAAIVGITRLSKRPDVGQCHIPVSWYSHPFRFFWFSCVRFPPLDRALAGLAPGWLVSST